MTSPKEPAQDCEVEVDHPLLAQEVLLRIGDGGPAVRCGDLAEGCGQIGDEPRVLAMDEWADRVAVQIANRFEGRGNEAAPTSDEKLTGGADVAGHRRQAGVDRLSQSEAPSL